MDNPVTTKSGYARLQKRLQAALDSYYAVCETNAEAAAAGDSSVWHDNFAYEQNQRDMHKWAHRITEIKKIVEIIHIIQIPHAPVHVQVGCVVGLYDEDEDKEWNIEIAGYEDGDVSQGRISYTAPLAKKIMGGEVGDEYQFFFSGKNRTIIISSIARTEESNRKNS